MIVNEEINLSDSFVQLWLPGTAIEGITDVIFTNKNNEINYYDSYGSLPIPLIQAFIKKLKLNYIANNYNPVIIYNDKRHQYGGSECGMYSMNFILERLNGVNMYDISNRKIKDKDMNELRYYLYSHN